MVRIQRKRSKGWRMPGNSKYIGRPSKWGNPFRNVGDMVYIYDKWRLKAGLDPWIYLCMKHEFGGAVQMFKDCVLNNLMVYIYDAHQPAIRQLEWVSHFRTIHESLHELYGYDLCCWCGLDQECHSDVLMELVDQRN